jgi:hypothetical protein
MIGHFTSEVQYPLAFLNNGVLRRLSNAGTASLYVFEAEILEVAIPRYGLCP